MFPSSGPYLSEDKLIIIHGTLCEIIFYANYSDIHGQHIILFEFMA